MADLLRGLNLTVHNYKMGYCTDDWRVSQLPGVVQNCVKSVGYSEDSTIRELPPYSVLDQVVCFQIHGGCSFIQDQYLGLLQECAREADQLSLSNTVTTYTRI